jgi:DNA-binding MarR family transcriptional regulator
MYRIKDWDNKEKIIKRLSKYEKRTIYYLYGEGTIKIKTMQETIGMPHRSSMSRLIKTLEEKGLILTRPRKEGGKYKKRISLTPAGERVGDWINDETPMRVLIPLNAD